MRIVFDARTCTQHFPGVGRYVRSLLGAMTAQLDGDELVVLTGPDVSGLPLMDAQGVSKLTVPAGPLHPIQHAAAQAIRATKGDIYHAPYPFAPRHVAMPTVLTLHDLIPLDAPQYSTWQARLAYRCLVLPRLRRAHELIAVSQSVATRAHHRLGAHPPKTTVIYHGIDPAFGLSPPLDLKRVRRQLRLPERFVLYVGSDRPHKNLAGLIDSIVTWPADLSLVIAGLQTTAGPGRARAKERGVDDRIRWCGAVPEPDLPALYATATVFAFPSRAEGFGLPVLEALASGVPVVMSELPVLREVAGTAALSVAPDDVAGWSSAIGELARNAPLRQQQIEAGQRRAAAFRWDLAARQTLQVYRRVAVDTNSKDAN